MFLCRILLFLSASLFLSRYAPVTVVAILKKMAPETPSPATKGQLFFVFGKKREETRVRWKERELDGLFFFFVRSLQSFLGTHGQVRHQMLCFTSPLARATRILYASEEKKNKTRSNWSQKEREREEREKKSTAPPAPDEKKKKNGRRDFVSFHFAFFLLSSVAKQATYSFLTSFTAVVRAGSVANACGGKRGIVQRG